MATGLDDLIVGGQLRVGTGICPPIKEGDTRINGSAMMEGPVVIGAPNAEGGGFGENVATLMIARTTNTDEDCEPAARSLHVKGNTRLEGDVGTPFVLNVSGNVTIIGTTTQVGDTTQTGILQQHHILLRQVNLLEMYLDVVVNLLVQRHLIFLIHLDQDID